MAELTALFGEGVRQFSARVAAVGPDDWGKPTPDADWSVADLVEHLIDEHRWMPPLLGGHDLQTAEGIVKAKADAASPDHAAEWASAAIESSQAMADPDVLSRNVQLSRGPTPAAQYVAEMIFDLTVHAWDLQRAVGYEGALPDELVSFVFDIAKQFGDMSSTGMFAAPVSVPDDAPLIDRLVAATGRDPSG